jgi:hypothetical protein
MFKHKEMTDIVLTGYERQAEKPFVRRLLHVRPHQSMI